MPVGKRIVDRLDPRLVNVVTVVGFALPIVGYFWLIHHYSVNVIFGDQWDDVTVIQHSYSHLFDWGSLWAQHNENRIFFPNLIVVFLAHTTHFNIQVEEYLSAIMLVVATALLIWAHKRRSASTPWLYYVPVVFLALSTVQYENALWGFQMAWYLVLFSMATAVVLVDRVTLTWLVLIGAIAAAVIGSFSSLQGLLIWPAGLLLLYHRRRPLRFVIVWFVAAMVSAIIYFYNFNTNATSGSPSHGYALQHPLAAIKFYVFEVGDIVGLPRVYNGPGSNPVLLLGVVILVLAVLTLIAYGIRRDEEGGGPVGVALICVGLLFVAIVTTGRIRFGYLGASASRYTTYDLLIPIGIFLTMLKRPAWATEPPRSRALPAREPAPGSERRRIGVGAPSWIDRALVPVARWVLAAVIVVQIAFGLHYGPQGARTDHAYQAQAAHVLRNINHTSDGVVGYYLYLLQSPAFIRRQARIVEMHHLSLFAPGAG
jgi:hypothetical protein